MDPTDNRSEKKTFARLAAKSGLAIAVVDDSGREIYVANNNSICRNLNPSGALQSPCTEYCGKALDHVSKTGKMAAFECHAGLECRAIPVNNPNTPLVAIIGRTFVKAENYRKATERAVSGDWNRYSPSEIFGNILLTNSEEILQATAKQVDMIIRASQGETAPDLPSSGAAIESSPEPRVVDLSPNIDSETEPLELPSSAAPPETSNLVEKFNREIRLEPAVPIEANRKLKSPSVPLKGQTVRTPIDNNPENSSHQKIVPVHRDKQANAWRSFFGSILKTDYPNARNAMLELIAAEYGFSGLIWLDRNDGKFESKVGFGDLKNRQIRLGVSTDDPRLLEALAEERCLELGERATTAPAGRTMCLFPIGIGGEISSAIAILDSISDEAKIQIARMCHSIAPQFEILRLRSEVAQRRAVAAAVTKFGTSLRQIDNEDFWIRLVQNAAEIMRSERGSLLMYNEAADKLEVKAVVGVKEWKKNNDEIGGRVAKFVVARHRALVIPDVTKTRLPLADPARQYKTDSFMSCPVSIGDRIIGVMNFTDQASGGSFDDSSLELYQAFAPQMAVAIDRASLKSKAGELEQLSVTDPLTGLLNRRYIEARLLEEIKRSNRHGFPMSFMMLDVDLFKSYNDSFGHPAGDEALKLVGSVIRETLRGADVAARFGGEEFAILLPQTTSGEAIAIGERLRQNIEQADFQHRHVTVSIGVASCSAELCILADLVSAADQALYEAKKLGRNLVLAFEQLAASRVS
ncbi:MAG: diguanylate cyclase [Pyrinomonadaceae bacterium]